MKLNISDIVAGINENKRTGILTFIFSSEKNLLKIYFKNGEIYYISFGLKKGLSCLNELDSKELISHNFIPDITIDFNNSDVSTKKVIEILKEKNKFLVSEEKTKTTFAGFEKIKEVITIALIRQIGPIGGKISEKYMQEKLIPSASITREELLNLIKVLSEEIDDPNSRKEFITEVNNLLEVSK